MREILKELDAQDFERKIVKNGHWKITNPTPSNPNPGRSLQIPNSPSSTRNLLNHVSRLRRELGFVWNGH